MTFSTCNSLNKSADEKYVEKDQAFRQDLGLSKSLALKNEDTTKEDKEWFDEVVSAFFNI